MATIYLDNLVKPKLVNNNSTLLTNYNAKSKEFTYVDLHLDLKLTQNVGIGLNPVNTNDIEVDYDKRAISNSIYNLFSSRQGFKVLTPEFAGSLDKYIFEPVSQEIASFIGNEMLTNINRFEPRIRVVKLYIEPVPDEGMYKILLNFEIIQSGLLYDLELKFNTHRFSTYNTIELYEQ